MQTAIETAMLETTKKKKMQTLKRHYLEKWERPIPKPSNRHTRPPQPSDPLRSGAPQICLDPHSLHEIGEGASRGSL